MKPDQVQAGAFRDNLLQHGHQHGGVQLSQGTFQTLKTFLKQIVFYELIIFG